MKVIFLDIDGVLNTLQISTKPFKTSRGQVCRDGFYYKLSCDSGDLEVANEQAVMWLNKLCVETGAKIVISSTWRLCPNGFENTCKALRNTGLLDTIEIIGCTGRRYDEHINRRGAEIKDYLDLHPEISKFIILDDDSDMGELKDYLVQCNTHVGFTYIEYAKALNLLIG